MSSPNQGLWSTLAMFIPLMAVPFLAAIGIPQLTPTASSSEEAAPELGELAKVEVGVGESLHHGAQDLFAPLEDKPAPGQTGGSAPAWENPFQQNATEGAAREQMREPARSLDLRSAPAREERVEDAMQPDRRPGADADRFSGGSGAAMELGDEAPIRPFASESPFGRIARPQREETPAAKQALTWSEAVRRLNDLGIQDFQLNPGQNANQFHFACTYTPPESPRVIHRFEAEAADPLAAVEQVLQQVKAWRGAR
jgi:hypothetical protein